LIRRYRAIETAARAAMADDLAALEAELRDDAEITAMTDPRKP
jgi:hypothetical protein